MIVPAENRGHLTDLTTDSSSSVLVYYTAAWCQPCKQLSPILEQLSEEMTDIIFVKVDIDKVTPIDNIQSVPTLHLFREGMFAGQVKVGSKSAVKKSLESYL